MAQTIPAKNVAMTSVTVEKIEGFSREQRADILAVEEPLEIRLDYQDGLKRVQKSISITMRTPGHDIDLALGFLFTEGVLSQKADILDASHCGPILPELGHSNVIKVRLASSVELDLKKLERHFYTSSSCGVCGKSSLEALKTQSLFSPSFDDEFKISRALIHSLPSSLRAAQEIFDQTGGLHASALFDPEGNLILLREDVGRHNALDKVIGSALSNGSLPLRHNILLLSGRVSFELVQKASMAGIRILAAVGAPSSLALKLAEEMGLTMIGFVRENRFNIYCGARRIF